MEEDQGHGHEREHDERRLVMHRSAGRTADGRRLSGVSRFAGAVDRRLSSAGVEVRQVRHADTIDSYAFVELVLVMETIDADHR